MSAHPRLAHGALRREGASLAAAQGDEPSTEARLTPSSDRVGSRLRSEGRSGVTYGRSKPAPHLYYLWARYVQEEPARPQVRTNSCLLFAS